MISVGDWKLHLWGEMLDADSRFPVYQPHSSIDWVREASLDPRVAACLRTVVGRRVYSNSFRLPNGAVRKLAAREVDLGKLRILARRKQTETIPIDKPPDPGPFFPLEERRSQASSSSSWSDDESTFSANSEPGAQASALREAANSGAPFCEECAKAAKASGNQV